MTQDRRGRCAAPVRVASPPCAEPAAAPEIVAAEDLPEPPTPPEFAAMVATRDALRPFEYVGEQEIPDATLALFRQVRAG